MADKSNISWTDATWNIVTGCTKVSPGCDNCYAETFAERWRGKPDHYFTNGFDLTLRPERLTVPLSWRKPRLVFVNSMSDLFHAQVPDELIAAAWTVMYWTSSYARGGIYSRKGKPTHTYQVLTKRHARMRSWVRGWGNRDQRVAWVEAARERGWCDGEDVHEAPHMPAVLPNVWLGVSVENQKWADLRIPVLLDTAAALRFLSCEPLLGPIDLGIGDPHRGHQSDNVDGDPHPPLCLTCSTDDSEVRYFRREPDANGLGWVIAGGESGSKRRPMELPWLTDIVDACRDAQLPVWVKQDTGPRPGKQGRIPDDYWIQQMPAQQRA